MGIADSMQQAMANNMAKTMKAQKEMQIEMAMKNR